MGGSDEVAVLSVFCSTEHASALRTSLGRQAIDVQASERRNLDGAASASWVVVATVAIKTLPATLQALSDFLRRNEVECVQVGDVVIKKPRPEDVDAALRGLPDTRSS